MHWRVEYDSVRKLIPRPIEIDTYDGGAWVSITPLHIYNVRPAYLPPVPYFSWLHELNVRTYVHYDGVPGVWFFSLDANSFSAVVGARTLFALPYYEAKIDMEDVEGAIRFQSQRTGTDARLSVTWSIGEEVPRPDPESLDHFLLERYALYTSRDDSIYRCRIHHQPWPIQKTEHFSGFHSSMAEVNGLPRCVGDPLLHCGGPVHVDVWPLENVASTR